MFMAAPRAHAPDVQDLIQSLWIGPAVSALERLSITSFLKNGHPFRLYIYQETAGIPPGVEVYDANEILPASRIFKYKEYNTYAGFANFFRYKLLLEKGGWWADTDTVCLRPFEFPEPFVFSSERGPSLEDPRRVQQVNNGILKSPAGSPILEEAWSVCQSVDPRELRWGQCGPALMARLVKEHSLEQYVRPPEVFCPLDYPEWEEQLNPAATWSFGEETVAVHLWNELWNRAGRDKDAPCDEGCLYEQLKRRYLPQESPAGLKKTIAT
jgi:hypothetical protein